MSLYLDPSVLVTLLLCPGSNSRLMISSTPANIPSPPLGEREAPIAQQWEGEVAPSAHRDSHFTPACAAAEPFPANDALCLPPRSDLPATNRTAVDVDEV